MLSVSARLPEEGIRARMSESAWKFANVDTKYYMFHIPFNYTTVPLLRFIFSLSTNRIPAVS